jgi:hypothetical protein
VRKSGDFKILAFPPSPNDIYHIKILGEKVKRTILDAEWEMRNQENLKALRIIPHSPI